MKILLAWFHLSHHTKMKRKTWDIRQWGFSYGIKWVYKQGKPETLQKALDMISLEESHILVGEKKKSYWNTEEEKLSHLTVTLKRMLWVVIECRIICEPSAVSQILGNCMWSVNDGSAAEGLGRPLVTPTNVSGETHRWENSTRPISHIKINLGFTNLNPTWIWPVS